MKRAGQDSQSDWLTDWPGLHRSRRYHYRERSRKLRRPLGADKMAITERRIYTSWHFIFHVTQRDAAWNITTWTTYVIIRSQSLATAYATYRWYHYSLRALLYLFLSKAPFLTSVKNILETLHAWYNFSPNRNFAMSIFPLWWIKMNKNIHIMVWRLVRYASRNIIRSIMSVIAHLGKYSTLNHRKLLMCV